LISVNEGIVDPPLAVLTPEIEAGTVVAVHVITALGVGEETVTRAELVPEQMV
jgi:hypothetical protein